MSSLLHYETLVGQVGAEGVTCLMALAIESPQPLENLAALIRREARKARTVLDRLMRYGYAGPVAPLDFSKWHITSKGREILGIVFHLFLGRGSDPRQLALPLSGSDPVQLAHSAAGSDHAAQEVVDAVSGLARGARAAITHSDHDPIDPSHDQSRSDLNDREPAPRDLQAVAAALERHGIRDFDGKPNRTRLLQDAWITAERIDAAVERARHNPLRKSPSPLGLAVAELLAHRPEIDEMVDRRPVNGTRKAEEESGIDAEPVALMDHPQAQSWSAAMGELQLEMTRATFETWLKPGVFVAYEAQTRTYVIALPNAYAVEWLTGRLNSTVERILTGIDGSPQLVRWVLWNDWARQHSTK
jgi:hypothetical protein